MLLVVIPTYNRSAKLERVIDFYARENPKFKIVILDASDDLVHQVINKKTAENHSEFVERIETPEQKNLVERLVTFLERIDDEIVAIGNDEDIFFPEFLDAAFSQLQEHSDYVVATGRYITSARPIFGIRRISYWTDSFLGLDVDDNDSATRVINYQRLNAGGVPPLHWSVHRKSAFIEGSRLGLRLKYSGAVELMNQITSCVLGKIWISEQPMLLRDESRLNYVPEANRDEGKLYIGANDLNEVVKIASEIWGDDVVCAVKAVTSWYRPQKNGESYQSRIHGRSYCRFNVTLEAREKRTLRWLQSAIKWSCTFGILLSQVFAYAYFSRYMFLKGRGRIFMKVTKTIPVNK